jgi:glycosyltransferase involved in cell wall biosynthesis
MYKFIFFDTSNDGHHFQYNIAAMQGLIERKSGHQVWYASPLKDEKKIDELRANNIQHYYISTSPKFMPGIMVRIIQLIKLFLFSRKNNFSKIHLFYLDCLIIPLLMIVPLIFPFQITTTLHWFPNRKLKIIGINFLLRKNILSKVIVHGDYTRNLFQEIYKSFRNKVISINYPNLHPIRKNNIEYDLTVQGELKEMKKPYILCFGGLRFDKGIDLLIKALHKIKDVEFSLIIAGKEEHFTKSYIVELLKEYGLEKKVHLNLEYIPDYLVSSYFSIADMVVLPYRKIFTGQSGPLTEGVIRQKVIVGPDNGEIGYTIKHYNLGTVFNSEDIEDLAEKLCFNIKNIEEIRKNIYLNQLNYTGMIQDEVFKRRYYDFFLCEET